MQSSTADPDERSRKTADSNADMANLLPSSDTAAQLYASSRSGIYQLTLASRLERRPNSRDDFQYLEMKAFHYERDRDSSGRGDRRPSCDQPKGSMEEWRLSARLIAPKKTALLARARHGAGPIKSLLFDRGVLDDVAGEIPVAAF
ncbi:hypothetical protein NLM31_08360 [Bradyrhizobium sp. CCGUVB4N]|uniref:hypothetical protein n=1 Tax=Bradyrhizobium sp. CCGUVB4N TaxID=2949631 RepID=UPI0020B1D0E9|nr:hypothetical protein [Bradyrhizobium sp. CCGUVB4N]MCP3380382.1 hypothetical protein [Bradyrhizobium sp. CCGUVB4N]